MPLTHILAVPLLILMALYLGFQVARRQKQHRLHEGHQRGQSPSVRGLAWTAVLVVAFTPILAEYPILPALWLQNLVLTVAPLAIGYVAGLVAPTSRETENT